MRGTEHNRRYSTWCPTRFSKHQTCAASTESILFYGVRTCCRSHRISISFGSGGAHTRPPQGQPSPRRFAFFPSDASTLRERAENKISSIQNSHREIFPFFSMPSKVGILPLFSPQLGLGFPAGGAWLDEGKSRGTCDPCKPRNSSLCFPTTLSIQNLELPIFLR